MTVTQRQSPCVLGVLYHITEDNSNALKWLWDNDNDDDDDDDDDDGRNAELALLPSWIWFWFWFWFWLPVFGAPVNGSRKVLLK